MAETFVTKYNDFYIKSTFLNDDIFLTVLAGKTAFSGQIAADKMAELQIKWPKFEDLQEMAKETLTTQSDRYSLSLEEESLIWRKLGGSAKLRLASFELSAFNFEDAQSEIIDFLVTSFLKNRTMLKGTKENLDAGKKDMEKMRDEISRLVSEKAETEQLLFNQFLPILNSKKERIVELEAGGGLSDWRSEQDTDQEDSQSTEGEEEGEEGEEEGGEGRHEGRKRKNSEDQDGEKAKRRLVPEEDEVEEDLEDGLFQDI